jgi:ribosomal protein S12 methylthiotransferase accessory factor
VLYPLLKIAVVHSYTDAGSRSRIQPIMTTPSPVSSLRDLYQSLGGLTGPIIDLQTAGDEPRFTVQTASMGNLNEVWPNIRSKESRHGVAGSGVGLNSFETMVPVLGESLERYCTCVFTKDQLVTATADELGNEALNLETIPVCSTAELSHPRCPLVVPDKKAPIRWVRGMSLLDGRLVYVPVVMAFIHAGCASPAEHFWFQITTGCAAHVSYERALMAAILEVIERDAISITWLQKLSLPKIAVDGLPPALAAYWECYQRSSKELEYFFFDATTDLGIPTIYGLQMARANKRLVTIVACSTALDPAEAMIKVLRDLAACRIFLRAPRPAPESWDEFTGLAQGGAYMGRAEQAHAFDFLLKSGQRRFLSDMNRPENQCQSLNGVLEVLRRKRLDAYAVDLSTDEALRSGMRVVRVLIPGLQPVGFQYRARYLGHPRLYEAPRLMGYAVREEADLNCWPQPFC